MDMALLLAPMAPRPPPPPRRMLTPRRLVPETGPRFIADDSPPMSRVIGLDSDDDEPRHRRRLPGPRDIVIDLERLHV